MVGFLVMLSKKQSFNTIQDGGGQKNLKSKSCYIMLGSLSHHQINNKCNRVKGWCWRWLIYDLCNFLLHNMLRVFRSNHYCSWKFHEFLRKTPVLESLFEKSCRPSGLFHICFCLYPIIDVNYVVILRRTLLWIFGKRFMKTLKKKNIHFTTNISLYMGQRHFEVLWSFILHINVKVCFVFKKQSLCSYSIVYV